MTNGTSTNSGVIDKHQSTSSEPAKCNMDLLHIANNSSIIRNPNDDNEERRTSIYDRDDDCMSPRTNNDSINVSIYRYKFTDDFTNEMYKFSKVHQYDHRKDFKEAWNTWVEENNDIVTGEIKRLTEMGYDGDILDKMFKSARYYFRKKSTEKNEPQARRTYIGSQKELLEAMDDHIMLNIVKSDYKPSNAFNEFCQENIKLLQEEVSRLCKSGLTDKNEIKNKVKKTYKNRYFIISKNN
jgi:hypothetical protein